MLKTFVVWVYDNEKEEMVAIEGEYSGPRKLLTKRLLTIGIWSGQEWFPPQTILKLIEKEDS